MLIYACRMATMLVTEKRRKNFTQLLVRLKQVKIDKLSIFNPNFSFRSNKSVCAVSGATSADCAESISVKFLIRFLSLERRMNDNEKTS